jgi:hypothetical protein
VLNGRDELEIFDSIASLHSMTTPFLSRLTYSTGYYLSYGVVFPTLFFLRAVPGAQAVVSGFVDGAAAARHYVGGLRELEAAQGPPASENLTARPATVQA